MKLLAFLGFIFLFGWFGSGIKKSSQATIMQKTIQITDTLNFATQIQPILVKHCSPCHFTGGKMYERMPFDKDTTIINHEKGILKRIKGEENDLLKTFIQQHKETRPDR